MALVNTSTIIEAVTIALKKLLAEYEILRVTTCVLVKGALFARGCAFIGGLVGGPIGLGVGGIVGACTAAYEARGKLKSMVHVLMFDIAPHLKENLVSSLLQAFNKINLADILPVLSVITTDGSVKAIVLGVLDKFLTNEGFLIN